MRKHLILAALGLAALAPAQTVQTPTNLAFRIGYVYPIDAKTRDSVRNFFGIGAEYFFNHSLVRNGELTLSADWLGKTGSGDKGNIFPIFLNQRFYGGSRTGDEYNRSYFYVGAGIAIVDVTRTDTVLAARVGWGMEFGEHLFGETTLIHSDDASGARATSLGFYLGYRF
ncbi:MAG: hypothetical protein KIT11_08350 [Fimbriimonadaceae bacterium]|nr:hypothetical protein [Fimbriimonadaceae bacterium]QYK56363.1 MAG: hypothetical protein KF733_02545 [Fimbriimonadaceae bacterium]